MKMNDSLFAILIIVVLSLGCSQDLGIGPAKNQSSLKTPSDTSAELKPGVHDLSIVLTTGEVLRYTISIPENFDAQKPTPLIVALHFGGQVTPHYAHSMVEMLILPGLAELNAIVVAPDSIAGPWTNEKNEAAVLELMDVVSEQFKIDTNKTLLTGFSMGGHGTWYIGSRHQNRFAAMIPIAGAPAVEDDVKWTTPVYVIHSRADTVVPIQAAEKYVAAQKEQGNEQMVFAAVDNLPHFQTGSFAVPLKEAVPWVKEVWAGKSEVD